MTERDPRADALYNLLPTVYRLRDTPERGEPLRALLALLGEQSAAIEESLAQLHDDLFAETAAPWVLPYIAELIGLRGVPGSDSVGMTPRAEVANTIGYRRRKGTAAVLEQLARDVTGWPARVVEYFELLVGTQYMNHLRPRNRSIVDVRSADRLQWVDTPFERLRGQDDLPHVVDVRRIASGRGRYNIPNIGIHLWRLRPYPLTGTVAAPIDPPDQHRYFLNPLGADTPLFTLPFSEDEITHLAEPLNVPLPISRKVMALTPASYYPASVSIEGFDVDKVDICDLADSADSPPGWGRSSPPAGRVALDPSRGRILFGDQTDPPTVSYHYGFSANVGGGEYDRVRTFGDIGNVKRVSQQDPGDGSATVVDGLAALGNASGTVEIDDSGRYEETPELTVNGRRVELRAADKHRPVLLLDGELVINGDDDGELTINGLVIAGGALRVTGLRTLRLSHCTLVPGSKLNEDGSSVTSGAVSLIVESEKTQVEIDSCILGGLRVHVDADLAARNSIVDAGEGGIAYADQDGAGGGGELRLDACTVLGRVHARTIQLVSNSILLARVPKAEAAAWPSPVLADRKQAGCIRFSWLPAGSRTPRRHRCQPERDADAAWLRPVLTSSRYADPGYCQLDRRTPDEIRRGADDEAEMGVFHDLYQPQREDYLNVRLEEYLRFGLESGIFFET